MKDMLKYKGYYGLIHFDETNLILFGKVEFVKTLISYEGESAAEIKQAFEEVTNDYLEMCEMESIIPENPFKCTFNIRIGESLHERAFLAATGRGIKFNEFVKQAVKHELKA